METKFWCRYCQNSSNEVRVALIHQESTVVTDKDLTAMSMLVWFGLPEVQILKPIKIMNALKIIFFKEKENTYS